MKKILVILLFVASVASVPAEAQGLSGLLKKGKEAIEKSKKSEDKMLGKEETGAEVNSEQAAAGFQVNGIEVVNPIKVYMDVEPLGLYGVPTSETKGDLYLVMKVRNKYDKESALFGSSINNKKMMAADDNGNVYNIDSSGAMRYDTPTDMLVKIVMDEPAMMFTNVNRSLTVMPMVTLGINLDASHKGNLTFKNVPIFWDEVPE